MNVQAAQTRADDAADVIELPRAVLAPAPHDVAAPAAPAIVARHIAEDDWHRFEAYVGEIFTALGMDLDTPGTRETPARFLNALYDSTAGYDGDPSLIHEHDDTFLENGFDPSDEALAPGSRKEHPHELEVVVHGRGTDPARLAIPPRQPAVDS